MRTVWIVAILLGAALLVDCAKAEPTLSPTPTPSPAATPTLVASIGVTPPVTGFDTIIVSVVDGDTIDVNINGLTQRVRLIGVDTPEVFGGVDCFGPEASAFTPYSPDQLE